MLLNKEKYTQDLLELVKMLHAKLVSTPMIIGSPLFTKVGDTFENATLYRSIGGALYYVYYNKARDLLQCEQGVSVHVKSPWYALEGY